MKSTYGSTKKQDLIKIWYYSHSTYNGFIDGLVNYYSSMGIKAIDQYIESTANQLPPSMLLAVILSKEISGEWARHDYISTLMPKINKFEGDWTKRMSAIKSFKILGLDHSSQTQSEIQVAVRDFLLKPTKTSVNLAIALIALLTDTFADSAKSYLDGFALKESQYKIRLRKLMQSIFKDEKYNIKRKLLCEKLKTKMMRMNDFKCDAQKHKESNLALDIIAEAMNITLKRDSQTNREAFNYDPSQFDVFYSDLQLSLNLTDSDIYIVEAILRLYSNGLVCNTIVKLLHKLSPLKAAKIRTMLFKIDAMRPIANEESSISSFDSDDWE